MKAWLAFLGVEYPKTHDISLLLQRLSESGVDIEHFSPFIEFTSFAIQFRYEAFDETYEPLNREEIVLGIGNLIEAVEIIIYEK